MDKMKIIDLLIAGVPEVGLAIVLGLVVLDGNVFRRESLGSAIIKLIISIVVILSTIFLIRMNFRSIVSITFAVLFMYIITFKLVWGLNWRQSILSGGITMFELVAIEILTFKPLNDTFVGFLGDGNVYSARIFTMSFLRLAQIIFIVLSLKFKLNFSRNSLLTDEWSIMPKSFKISIILIIISVLSCILFNVNYSDMYFKSRISNINLDEIDFNMQVFFLETIWFFFISLLLIIRSLGYEENKKMLERDTLIEFLKDVSSLSSVAEREEYIEILSRGGESNEKI